MNNLVYAISSEELSYSEEDEWDQFTVLTDETLEDIPLLDEERLILRFNE